MKIISPANETVLKILSKQKKVGEAKRLLYYCVEVPVDEGILLHNLLTKELLLLTQDEYARLTELNYLIDHWFVVPKELNEKKCVDIIRWALSASKAKEKEIVNYTVFTTTDCNARCYYCFELGQTRIPMNRETALKVVEYISSHCGNKAVKITWFGGEPLFNSEVIDIICTGLCEKHIAFTSQMVSNGYLFNDTVIEKAVNLWKLKGVQITLDGTEDIYNRTKAYIYKEGNPYQIVLNNIARLLDASITVSIRLNLDLKNYENLMNLIDDLAQRFAKKDKLHVYAHHLFDSRQPSSQLYSQEEWNKRGEAMYHLSNKIFENKLFKGRIEKHLKINHCKADADDAVIILPNGNIGQCDLFTETEIVGHIDHDAFDQNIIQSWKETMPETPECAECSFYPNCIRLRKCTESSICFPMDRRDRLLKLQQAMLNEYDKWINQKVSKSGTELPV